MAPLLAALPWILLALLATLAFRRRPRLADYPAPAGGAGAPTVSVIVPARDEAENIGACVATLLASAYPEREVIVVDDGSRDGTAEVVRALAQRSERDVRVVDGAPLPEGWFGKPWACWQGAREASGELLLFTDADTRHDDDLLGHAVGAMEAERADLLSVLPHQRLDSFWERLVMPHVLTLIAMRYADLRRVNRTTRARDVVANGQFILVRREAYDAIGGHEAVRGDVVEDQRLAQRMVSAGRRIFLAHAEELLETRMYRGLRDLVAGWTKNLATGARHAVAPPLRRAIPWLVAATLLLVWVVPPAALVLWIFGATRSGVGAWALWATLASIAFWLISLASMKVPPRFALLYPLGALCVAGLFVRSAVRGARITWKGRSYGAPASPRGSPPPGSARPSGNARRP